jgi:hypothetical protein
MDKKVVKGDLIIMTSGNYSDYVIDTLCRALADFDIEEVRQEYLAQFPKGVRTSSRTTSRSG